MTDLLTPAELQAMDITVELVNVVCQEVIGRGPTRDNDVREFVNHIHSIQQAILSQAAGRAYPDRFRTLGELTAGWKRSDTPVGQIAAERLPVKAREELPALAEEYGWMELEHDECAVYYRWITGNIREEICVCFDESGRVEAWTVWHNKRVMAPDQAKGRRKRLTELITERTRNRPAT